MNKGGCQEHDEEQEIDPNTLFDQLCGYEVTEGKTYREAMSNVFHHTLGRRSLDEDIIREELLEGMPCLVQNWVDKDTRCCGLHSGCDGSAIRVDAHNGIQIKENCDQCGKQIAHSYKHNISGGSHSTVYYPKKGLLSTDADYSSRYNISETQWRGTVATNRIIIEAEKEVASGGEGWLPDWVEDIMSLKDRIQYLRDLREEPLSVGKGRVTNEAKAFFYDKGLKEINEQINQAQAELDALYEAVGTTLPETNENNYVKEFEWLPCSWLPQTSNEDRDEAIRSEYLKEAKLPNSKFTCRHVNVVLTMDAYIKLLNARGYCDGKERSFFSDGDISTMGELKGLNGEPSRVEQELHKQRYLRENKKVLFNTTTYEVIQTAKSTVPKRVEPTYRINLLEVSEVRIIGDFECHYNSDNRLVYKKRL